MNGVVKIDCWETTDGKLHTHKLSAKNHQVSINKALAASEYFDSGMSVGECLRVVGYPGNIPEILNDVTKDSMLVISHWQCRDTPGYKPIKFETGMSMRVWGDAGSYFGSYGGSVKIDELVRYASDDLSDLNPDKKGD